MENWRKYLSEGLRLNLPVKEPDWSRCVELKANSKYGAEIKCIPSDGVLDMRYFDTSSINPNDPQYSGYPGADQDQDKIRILSDKFNDKVLRGLIVPCTSSIDCAQKEQKAKWPEADAWYKAHKEEIRDVKNKANSFVAAFDRLDRKDWGEFELSQHNLEHILSQNLNELENAQSQKWADQRLKDAHAINKMIMSILKRTKLGNEFKRMDLER